MKKVSVHQAQVRLSPLLPEAATGAPRAAVATAPTALPRPRRARRLGQDEADIGRSGVGFAGDNRRLTTASVASWHGAPFVATQPD